MVSMCEKTETVGLTVHCISCGLLLNVKIFSNCVTANYEVFSLPKHLCRGAHRQTSSMDEFWGLFLPTGESRELFNFPSKRGQSLKLFPHPHFDRFQPNNGLHSRQLCTTAIENAKEEHASWKSRVNYHL